MPEKGKSSRLRKAVGHDLQSPIDVGLGVGQAKKTGFKLRGRNINALIVTEMEKRFERFQIGSLSISKILNWPCGKIEAKHRPDALEGEIGFREDFTHTSFKVRAESFQSTITILFFKLSQLSQTGCQGERVS